MDRNGCILTERIAYYPMTIQASLRLSLSSMCIQRLSIAGFSKLLHHKFQFLFASCFSCGLCYAHVYKGVLIPLHLSQVIYSPPLCSLLVSPYFIARFYCFRRPSSPLSLGIAMGDICSLAWRLSLATYGHLPRCSYINGRNNHCRSI